MSDPFVDMQQVLVIAHSALKLADNRLFSIPGNGDACVTVAQARDMVKRAICTLECLKKEHALVPKELLEHHIAEIDEWNDNMTAVVGYDPDYHWHSLESLRTYV